MAHFVNWQQDPQGNHVARLTFPEKVKELRLEVDLVAETAVYDPFDFFLEPQANTYPFAYADWQQSELQPFLRREPTAPCFAAYLQGIESAPRTVDFLVALNQKVHRDVGYVIRLEHGVQSKEETLTGEAAPAGTRHGYSCSSCGTSGWRPASSPAI